MFLSSTDLPFLKMSDPKAGSDTDLIAALNSDAGDDTNERMSIPLKASDASRTCIEGCKFDGKTTGAARTAGHVYCSLCYHYYHKDCIKVTCDVNVFWPCPSCRNLAADVKSLHSKLDSVVSLNQSLMDMITKQQVMLNTLMSVESKVSTLSDKLIPEHDLSDDETEEDAEPEGDLLIGDSLLRDVVPSADSLTVDSVSGATLSIIRKRLLSINPRKKRYQRVLIVAGTNDTASKRPTERIGKDCEATIVAAKRIAPNVVLSSVPPRCDDRANKEKVDNINQLFVTLANTDDVCFVNHDNNFHFRDNSIDTSLLLADQLHLSSTGVTKLLSNLGLSDKTRARTHKKHTTVNHQPNPWNASAPRVTPSAPPLMSLTPVPTNHVPNSSSSSPLYFRGSRSPLSNFYEAPITIWNMKFLSSEHAFQYRKCISLGKNSEAADVLKAPTPLDAKRIADQVRTDSRWDDIKQGAMYEILKCKSRQCPQFFDALQQSLDRPLIENTTNPYWGRGNNGQGLNMLGSLLTVLRSELSITEPQPRNFTPRPKNPPPRNQLGQTQPHSRHQQLRCFNCGEPSHSQATCRHPSPLRCHTCHGLGHKMKFCKTYQH